MSMVLVSLYREVSCNLQDLLFPSKGVNFELRKPWLLFSTTVNQRKTTYPDSNKGTNKDRRNLSNIKLNI